MPVILNTEADRVDSKVLHWQAGVWGFWSTAGLGLALLIISFIIQGIIAAGFIIGNIVNNKVDVSDIGYFDFLSDIDLGLLISLSVIISAVICTGILLIFIKARRGVSIAEYLGLKSFSLRTMLVGLGIVIVFIVAYSLVYKLFDTTAETDNMLESFGGTAFPVLFWLAMVVFAPVFEEVLFRGFLFAGFKNSMIRVAGSVLLTSLLWAGSHLQYQLFGIAIIFILGIILGIVRHRTGSLWIPMIMHGFNNLLAMIILALGIEF